MRALADRQGITESALVKELVAPLPKAEHLALKHAITEDTAIGPNLNENSRAMKEGRGPALPGSAKVGVMLKVAVQLRDHVRALLTPINAAGRRAFADISLEVVSQVFYFNTAE